MVYLLHFNQPYRHARHYTGFARDRESFEQRINDHASGRGARLMEVITQAGIGFTVARTWPKGTRTDERKLKNRGGASRYCPICRESHAA